jgi:hypothetical protein
MNHEERCKSWHWLRRAPRQYKRFNSFYTIRFDGPSLGGQVHLGQKQERAAVRLDLSPGVIHAQRSLGLSFGWPKLGGGPLNREAETRL